MEVTAVEYLKNFALRRPIMSSNRAFHTGILN